MIVLVEFVGVIDFLCEVVLLMESGRTDISRDAVHTAYADRCERCAGRGS